MFSHLDTREEPAKGADGNGPNDGTEDEGPNDDDAIGAEDSVALENN